jgi:hypothetical protein
LQLKELGRHGVPTRLRKHFDQSSEKLEARRKYISFYRKFSGNFSLPLDRQYWTLCAEQRREAGAEINQLVAEGLILPFQFHGVDRDEDQRIIAENCLNHPEANFYRGDFLSVIRAKSTEGDTLFPSLGFKPGIIYLDTQNWGNRQPALTLLIDTMRFCSFLKDVLICVNVMANSPRGKENLDTSILLRNLENDLPELDKWKREVFGFHYHMTGALTTMVSYLLYKEKV